MDPKKIEIIEEIIEHLSGAQAQGLKQLLDKSKGMPSQLPKEAEKDEEMAIPGGKESMREDLGEPEEKEIEVDTFKLKPAEGDPMKKMDMEKPEGMEVKEGEMTDEELEELLSKLKL